MKRRVHSVKTILKSLTSHLGKQVTVKGRLVLGLVSTLHDWNCPKKRILVPCDSLYPECSSYAIQGTVDCLCRIEGYLEDSGDNSPILRYVRCISMFKYDFVETEGVLRLSTESGYWLRIPVLRNGEYVRYVIESRLLKGMSIAELLATIRLDYEDFDLSPFNLDAIAELVSREFFTHVGLLKAIRRRIWLCFPPCNFESVKLTDTARLRIHLGVDSDIERFRQLGVSDLEIDTTIRQALEEKKRGVLKRRD